MTARGPRHRRPTGLRAAFWYAPRQSKITRADFVNVHFTPTYQAYPLAMCVLEGIYSTSVYNWEPGNMYSPINGGPESQYVGRSPWIGGAAPGGSCSPQSYNSKTHFSDNPTPHNIAAFRLFAYGHGSRTNGSSAQMDGASLTLEDSQYPTVNSATTSPGGGWVQSATIATNVQTRDATPGTPTEGGGLGMWVTALFIPKDNGGEGQLTTFANCANARITRCPESATFNYTYNTDTTDLDPNTAGTQKMPEGVQNIRGETYDATGKKSYFNAGTVKIDRTPPETFVEGTLRPEDREWVGAGLQTLVVDGEDATSGVVSAEVRIDGTLVEPAMTQDCAAGACPIEYDVDVNTDDMQPNTSGAQPLSEGLHHVVVTVRDAAGNPDVEEWDFRHDRTPPAVPTVQGLSDGQTVDPNATYQIEASTTEGSGSARSGLGTIEIVVDGEYDDEDSYEHGCPGGVCRQTLTREYSYVASQYDTGSHALEVTAIDRAGNEAVRTVTVNNPPEPAPECAPAPIPAQAPAAEVLTPTMAESSFRSASGLPEAFAPASVLDLVGEPIQPGLAATAGVAPFNATQTVAPLVVSQGPVSGAALRTETEADGPICLFPADVSAGASPGYLPGSLPLNQTGPTAFFANSLPASDTAVRPTISGAEVFTQFRSAAAPATVSWKVDLQPGLKLEKLADGSVAVLELPDPEMEAAPVSDDLPGPPDVASQRAAITDTGLATTQATDLLSRLEAPLVERIVAIVRKPWAKDADNRTVATSLAVEGSTVQMTVTRDPAATTYPVISSMQLSDASATEEADTARVVARHRTTTSKTRRPSKRTSLRPTKGPCP